MMSDCRCGYADECDGQYATFYPLQDGDMCAVVPCNSPIVKEEETPPKAQERVQMALQEAFKEGQRVGYLQGLRESRRALNPSSKNNT